MEREVAAALGRLAPALAPGATGIADLRRLTGGASLETWAFTAAGPGVSRALILRRRGAEAADSGDVALPLASEWVLLVAARDAGVPVPEPVRLGEPGDGLGEAYIVAHVAGETLGRRIVAGAPFAPARAVLGRQCGRALAAIHALDAIGPELPVRDAGATLAHYEALWREAALARSPIEAAFRWLGATAPAPVAPRLVHGDFRTGNLMVDPANGLVAVLDWELAHRGDPAEDLGWLCVNSWRFGQADREAGGFATLDEVLDAYAAAGGDPPPVPRIRWWQAMGSLKWAVITTLMARSPGLERLVIGRRLSECEADLVALMAA